MAKAKGSSEARKVTFGARKKGAAKDSRGRPGSLFFNAGRYAISTLNADVTVATTTPTTVATI